MATFRRLSHDLEKLAGSVSKLANDVAKDVGAEIAQREIYATPVDTSRALSNWRVYSTQPANIMFPPFFPGMGGSTANASSFAARALALAEAKKKREGEPLYVSNAAPYILALDEEGLSPQASAGFVEREIKLALDIVTRRWEAKFARRKV